MKRVLLFLTVAIFLVFAVGCGANSQTSDDHTTAQNSQETLDEKTETDETKQDQKKEDKDKKGDKKEDKEKKEDQTSESASKSSSTDNEKSKEKDSNSTTEKTKINDNTSSTKNNKPVNSSKEKVEKKHTKQTSKKDTPKQTKKEKENSSGKSKSKSDKKESTASNDNKPKNDSSSKENQKPKPPQKKVTVSVTTGNVKGTILSSTSVPMNDGDTALDVTIKILKEKGIQYSVRGANASAYMEGIDNLYEFDKGELSGWHIRVNGKMIDRSAGAWSIKDGDSINWNYTTNYLEDSEDW